MVALAFSLATRATAVDAARSAVDHSARSSARRSVVLPGGFGTLDEMFEALVLVQTQKITSFPVILVGSAYWAGLLDWLRQTMATSGNIAMADLNLVSVTDDADEVVRVIRAADGTRRGRWEAEAGAAAWQAQRAAYDSPARDDGSAQPPTVTDGS
jgi:hypothetical protein